MVPVQEGTDLSTTIETTTNRTENNEETETNRTDNPEPNDSETNEPQPAVTCHGTDWYNKDDDVKAPINGPVPKKQWKIKDQFGEWYTTGSNA